MTETTRELYCPACGWRQRCDLNGMLRQVQAAGMLLKVKKPEPAMVVELFTSAADRFCCDDCGKAVVVRDVADDDWPAAKKCAACGKTIPAARLEALPGAVHCASCQEKVDRGEPTGEREFCDYCGGLMTLRKAGSGLTRYVSRCSDCGR